MIKKGDHMKKMCFFIIALSVCFSAAGADGLKVKTNGTTFFPQSRLGVSVSQKDVSESLTALFYDGSKVLEQHEVVVNGGEVNFTTSEKQGAYRLEVIRPGSSGKPIAVKDLFVSYILASKLSFKPNEPMKVSYSTMNPEFKEGSWVGLFPSDLPKMNGEDIR